MKKVYQDSFGEKGTCYSACLASLLDMELIEVPRFMDLTAHLKDDIDARMEMWSSLTHDFVAKYNFKLNVYEDTNNYHEWAKKLDHDVYYIVIGESPRSSTRNHSVIYKNGYPYHDPNRENTFLVNEVEIQELEIIQ